MLLSFNPKSESTLFSIITCDEEHSSRLYRQHLSQPYGRVSQKIALEHGVDMSAHHARQINMDILKWADLILVMENGHKQEIIRKYPWTEGKVFRYGESVQVDIPDPYRRPESAFVLAWNFISKLTPYWVKKIKESEGQA